MVFLKILLGLLAALVLLYVGTYLSLSVMWSVPRFRGSQTDHFDGKRFHNLEGPLQPAHGFGHFLMMRITGRFSGKRSWPPGPAWPEWVNDPAEPKPPERSAGLRVTFVNHATMLIQVEGVNILTDPQWSERASPVSWAGPRRHRAPGIRFEDLPPIDAILISHNHYDHMDLPTLHRLVDAHHPRILVTLNNADYLKNRGIPAEELDWWQTAEIGGLHVSPVAGKHFSARFVNDRNNALWCGFVVQGEKESIYFAGDTGYGQHFKEIGRRYPHLRLALIPIGAYLPRWFMQPVHLSPEEAVQASADLGADISVPMHYGTFKLSQEGFDQPLQDLQKELDRRGAQAPRWVVLKAGEGKDL